MMINYMRIKLTWVRYYSESRRALQRDLLASSDSEGEDVADILGGRQKQSKSSYEIRQEKVCII